MVAKETKVAKELIVISSSDDEVSSDDAVSSDEKLTSYKVSSEEEVIVIASIKGPYKSFLKWYNDSSNEDFPEYYFAMPKASNSRVYIASALKASASKASTLKTLKVSTSSTSSSSWIIGQIPNLTTL
ncbi:hypothetical protein Tco_0268362 [Tanacetum coccineum]